MKACGVFPTGWDSPDWDDLQPWAGFEVADGIDQRPLDACPFIPSGSTVHDDCLGPYVNTVLRNQ